MGPLVKNEMEVAKWQLAELSGVHYMKIHQIETGKIKPENITLKNALKLAKALGCTPDELL